MGIKILLKNPISNFKANGKTIINIVPIIIDIDISNQLFERIVKAINICSRIIKTYAG